MLKLTIEDDSCIFTLIDEIHFEKDGMVLQLPTAFSIYPRLSIFSYFP